MSGRDRDTKTVALSEGDLESLQETLFWLSQPGIRDDIAEARQAAGDGRTVGAKDLRARYELPVE